MSVKTNDQEEDLSKVASILNAAQKRFGQYGLCKTTMSEIATDIGLSKAALYYYYPDKENLFEAVIQKEQKEFVEELEREIQTCGKASVLLLTYVKKRQDYFNRFMNLGKLRYETLNSSKPFLCRLSESLIDKEKELLSAILERGIANKEFKKLNVKEYAAFLIPLLQGLRCYAIKVQKDLVMNEEEHATLNGHLSKAIQMVIRDISIS